MREYNLPCPKYPTLYFSCSGLLGQSKLVPPALAVTQLQLQLLLFSAPLVTSATQIKKHHGWKRTSVVVSRKVTLSVSAARFALNLFFFLNPILTHCIVFSSLNSLLAILIDPIPFLFHSFSHHRCHQTYHMFLNLICPSVFQFPFPSTLK